jgi:NTE family protein
MEKQKVPVVLSGGGARGFAHVGILKALEEHQIYPSAISATSAGAMVGALIADGYHPAEVKELVLKKVKLTDLLDFKRMNGHLISLHKIGQFLKAHLRATDFEQLQLPFYVTAVNYNNGTPFVFQQGPIVEAVLAASSIPTLFEPTLVGNIPYVDGALYSNLPLGPLEDQIDQVIACHVNPIAPYLPKSSVFHLMDRAIHLSFLDRINRVRQRCKWFIEPYELYPFGMFEVHRLAEIYEVGYKGALAFLEHPGNNNSI